MPKIYTPTIEQYKQLIVTNRSGHFVRMDWHYVEKKYKDEFEYVLRRSRSNFRDYRDLKFEVVEFEADVFYLHGEPFDKFHYKEHKRTPLSKKEVFSLFKGTPRSVSVGL
jgi:hypothetical protein